MAFCRLLVGKGADRASHPDLSSAEHRRSNIVFVATRRSIGGCIDTEKGGLNANHLFYGTGNRILGVKSHQIMYAIVNELRSQIGIPFLNKRCFSPRTFDSSPTTSALRSIRGRVEGKPPTLGLSP